MIGPNGWAARAAGILVLALGGCSTAPSPPSADVPPQPIPVRLEPLVDARAVATEHFYRGKAYALSGDAACARIEFDDALEQFRLLSRKGDPEDLNFAWQLWESVNLYRSITEGKGEIEDRPPAEESPDSLIAISPAPTPEEVDRVKTELAAEATLTFDIPIVVNDAVLRAIAFYQFRNPQAFAAALKRSGRYLPLMRKIFFDLGLPQDLVYVAMIESAFKPQAHSRKGAHGFWQFIDGTAKRYGLKKTRAVEERSDPVKSTRAAAAYFKDLFEMLGDWHLAMAGYDAGEGRILRGLQRTGARDYWELAGSNYLPRETRDYVPFVLAAALIGKNPSRYGFDVVPDPPMEFEIVVLEKPLDLASAAARLGTSVDDLKLLNGELRTRLTPAGGPYPLRVPPGRGEALRGALASLPTAPPIEERRVKVKKGDTLPKIAARYRISVAELADWNDLAANARLKAGTTLVVPSRAPASGSRTEKGPLVKVNEDGAASPKGQIRALPTPAAAVTDPDSIAGRSAVRSTPVPLPSRVDIPAEGFSTTPEASGKPAAPSKSGMTTYVVQAGDTLTQIAARFGVSVSALQKANHLKAKSTLQPGRKLVIPKRKGR